MMSEVKNNRFIKMYYHFDAIQFDGTDESLNAIAQMCDPDDIGRTKFTRMRSKRARLEFRRGWKTSSVQIKSYNEVLASDWVLCDEGTHYCYAVPNHEFKESYEWTEPFYK